MSPKDRRLRFGEFELIPEDFLLLKAGQPILLTPKSFLLLQTLMDRAGFVVSKAELMDAVWGESFVEEGNLTFTVSVLRKALGDSTEAPRYIETIPKRGYRFLADIIETGPETERSIPESSALPSKTPSTYVIPRRRNAFYIAAGLALLVLVAMLLSMSYFGKEKGIPILAAPFQSQTLSASGNVLQAAISADGNNVVYVSKSADQRQSIWIRQLATGNNVEIIPPSNDFYNGLKLSRDGNLLYFVRQDPARNEGGSLYRIPIFGGIPVKIADGTEADFDVSSDGQKVSFVRCTPSSDEYCSLFIADSANGQNEKKLTSTQRPIRITANTFSPDGTSIVLASGQTLNASNNFLFRTIDLDTGDEHIVDNKQFCNVRDIVWLSGRTDWLITARKAEKPAYAIWLVDPSNGKTEQLSRDSLNFSTISADKSGAKVVSVTAESNFKVRRFLIDGGIGTVLGDATSVAFSGDGSIIYSSFATGNSEIWSMRPDGTARKQLTSDPTEDGPAIGSFDGSVIYFTSARTGSSQIWKMRSDGTELSQVTFDEGGFPLYATPDGEWLYYHGAVDRFLRRISLRTSQDQTVIAQKRYHFAVSSNGKFASYREPNEDGRQITVVRLEDGQVVKTFPMTSEYPKILMSAWKPNSSDILYITADLQYKNKLVWSRSLDGGEPQRIAELGDDEIRSFSVAPDGKSFAVTVGSWIHDAVLITGLK